jgi:phosphomannomutase/phosphomannomutase/phosphoglucomutase
LEIARNAFKAYDIRGRVPKELNEELVYRLGRAFVKIYDAKEVIVGRDVRLSSAGLANALIRGLNDAGCKALDIGLCGTERVYFATAHLQSDGGIMVTASHNPMDYNGLKLVRSGARPVSGDTGLRELEDLVINGDFSQGVGAIVQGTHEFCDIMAAYIEHLLTYVNIDKLRPLKIVVNAGNGCAGSVLDALEKHLPFELIKIHHTPDGTFPNGIPNPLLPDRREDTAQAVRQHKADLGIAWDGDFDRCFLFDHQGNFIEGYYMVGLLAQAFLRKHPQAKIIHDPRLTWNTIELVRAAGGIPVQSKTGHAFIKERMRLEDAVYGGEMSAHHYFRDFFYCDSGMIPWLLVAEEMSISGKTLAEMVGERMERYPVSGEINVKVADANATVAHIEKLYAGAALAVDRTDGVSLEYEDWRFNLRMSNTEPVLRLNVEARGNRKLMEDKTKEILHYIRLRP